MDYESNWNRGPRDEQGRFITPRLEASVNGYRLQKGVAYQFDLYEGGRVVTCTWTGVVDTDGCPEFQEVDGARYHYCPRSATFFAPLAELTA